MRFRISGNEISLDQGMVYHRLRAVVPERIYIHYVVINERALPGEAGFRGRDWPGPPRFHHTRCSKSVQASGPYLRSPVTSQNCTQGEIYVCRSEKIDLGVACQFCGARVRHSPASALYSFLTASQIGEKVAYPFRRRGTVPQLGFTRSKRRKRRSLQVGGKGRSGVTEHWGLLRTLRNPPTPCDSPNPYCVRQHMRGHPYGRGNNQPG